MSRNERHVVPNPNGGWDVVAPNASRVSAHVDTQAEGIDCARQIVGNTAGGEVVIHRPNGQIRDSDTVPPGNDPNPPRDRKWGPTVAYRNKTFVSFASEDIDCYRIMCAWRKNEHIEFDFHDAHDLNVALDTSQPETIRRRLRERFANTKQVVLLVGDVTRAVAARSARFLHYEVEVIERLGLPVVFANLNDSRRVEASRLPARLESQYTISVPFRAKAIRYALDDFVARYPKERQTKTTPHFYKDHVYQQLGL